MLRQRLALDTWLQPLLYITADAAADSQMDLAAQALDAFSACVQHGSSLQVSLCCGQCGNIFQCCPMAQTLHNGILLIGDQV